MADAIRITAPATSANLGPGFDTLALALDFTTEVIVTRRPGPLEVIVTGEGADELPTDETNLVCRALASGLGSLDNLRVECSNSIPLRRGMGSSAAAACAGLVAANALGLLRWSPDEMVRRGAEFDGHRDNVAACVWGGIVAATSDGQVTQLPIPEDLLFVLVTPSNGVATAAARGGLPDVVSYPDLTVSLSNAVTLALMIERGDFEDLSRVLDDRLHEPYRAAGVPGLAELRGLVDDGDCRGATISGSGPSVLLWCTRSGAQSVADRAASVLADAGIEATARVLRVSPGGIRGRWIDTPETRLAKAVG